MAKQKMYSVFNNTDGIYASMDDLTMEEALKFLEEFPKRYAAQGYYKTNRWEKIDPYDVELEIIEIEQ